MRRVPNANRSGLATVSKGGGIGGVFLLSILYWLIFYQNLPWSLGGMASSGPVSTSNISDRVIKVCMIGVSLYVIASRWPLSRSLAKNITPGAAAFLVLAPVSALWSIEPTATLLRCVSLASIVLVCFAICVSGWNRYRFQQLALPPLMFILIASLIVGIILPDQIVEIGTDISQRNAWHGITHAKNEFGMIASLSAIICVNKWLSREGRTLWALIGTAVSFLCLFLSRSNTSLLATLVAVLTMVLLMRVPIIKRRFSTHVVVATAVTILLYELAIQNVIPGVDTLLAPVMRLTGKDTTFSARTIIWKVIREHMQAAPYLGTGYGAYWQPFPTSPSYVFVALMYFYPTEAHNGYLDVINDLGILGLICLLMFLFGYMRQSLQLMRTDRSQAALYLGILFEQMVMNMSESDWFSRSMTFSIFALGTTSLFRAVREARLQGQPAGSITARA